MKFKPGDVVRFVHNNDIMPALLGKCGEVIGPYSYNATVGYKVRMFDTELTPVKQNVKNWEHDYWVPDEKKLELVTKLERALL